MTTYEKFDARVTKIDDPEKRGRIKVTCPGLMGDDEEEVPMWIQPVHAWGWFIVPDIGEAIEIEGVSSSSDDEQFGQSSIDAPDMKWRGSFRYWGNSEKEEGQGRTLVPEDFTATNYGKRRGFATPGGHVMLFDDTDGMRKITMTWHSDGKYTSYSIDKDGSFVVNTHAGHLMYMNADNGEMSLIDPAGNHYRSKGETVSLMNASGCNVELKGANVQVLAMGAATVSAKNISLKAGAVDLGEVATNFALLGDLFMQLFIAHTHPTSMGPSGPPVPTGGEAACVSTTVKVQA
jgi:hypothetical protein